MKNRITIIVSAILCLFNAQLIAQSFEWAKRFGSSNNDVAEAVAADKFGNVYVTGNFRGTVDFDPGPGIFNLSSAGSEDVFIQKLDSNGNFIWAKSIGSTGNDFGFTIDIDFRGNCIISGRYRHTVDFDPGPSTFFLSASNTYHQDDFVLKLDSLGNFVWVRSFQTHGDAWISDVALDTLGNIYITGAFDNVLDVNPGPGVHNLTPTSFASYDVFIVKLGQLGGFFWGKSFGGVSNDESTAIAVDDSGNVFTTGTFWINMDADPGAGVVSLTSVGGTDVFIHKMDAQGNFIWAKAFDGFAGAKPSAIALDNFGNIILTGDFTQFGDFDPGPLNYTLTSVGFWDVFVMKLTPQGNFLWAKSFGGNDYERVYAIAISASGDVFTTGTFSSTVDFNTGPGIKSISPYSIDIYIHRLDMNGNFVSVNTIGGTTLIKSLGLAVDMVGSLYTVGEFGGTQDFNSVSGTFNLTSSQGSKDAFILKMSRCVGSPSLDVISACQQYTWIDGITYTSSIQTPKVTTTTSLGCDSIITLVLTIDTVSDISTSVIGTTITANNTSATYQWLDCDNNYTPISGATNQSFTATENGNYAVQLIENGCVDTSHCVAITTVILEEQEIVEKFLIFPNPAYHDISIDLSPFKDENLSIILFNSLGEPVFNLSNQQESISIDISWLPSGVYFLEVLSENICISSMVVIKRDNR